jgi:hypothetical protein
LNSAKPKVFRSEPVRPRSTADGTFGGRAEPAGLTPNGHRKRPDHNTLFAGIERKPLRENPRVFAIDCAFSPLRYAWAYILGFIGGGCARLWENTGRNISVFYTDGVGVGASRRPWRKQYRRQGC